MKKPTDILKKIDYKVIPYSVYHDCPNDDMRIFGNKPNLVGWCETPIGYMMVLECQSCFTRFRWHPTVYQNATLEDFNYSLLKKLYRDNKLGSAYFNNGQELYKKLFE